MSHHDKLLFAVGSFGAPFNFRISGFRPSGFRGSGFRPPGFKGSKV